MKVHLQFEVETDHLRQFQDSLAGWRVTLGDAPQDVEVLVSGRPSPEVLESLSSLQAVVIPFAGLIPATRDALLTRPELKVYNLHHNASATAEKALELLFAVAKRTVVNDRSMRTGSWAPRFDTSDALLLEGRHVVVLGYGEIGQRVARVYETLGMRVTAVRRTARRERFGTIEVVGQTELKSLSPTTQVLVVCAPLTDETLGVIDEAFLSSMPAGGLVVNVGRGAIIDERALYNSLDSGHLRGAGLDVWWQYPSSGEGAPSAYPFNELENVVMSPHVGGTVDSTEPTRLAALAELLQRFAKGDATLKPVNVQRGY